MVICRVTLKSTLPQINMGGHDRGHLNSTRERSQRSAAWGEQGGKLCGRPPSIINSLANQLLNSDPYKEQIKTHVTYDDLRAGIDRWGTMGRYQAELTQTEALLAKCGVEHITYACPVQDCNEQVELEYNCLNHYCTRGCLEKLSWRKHKAIYKVLKSYNHPRKFEIGWQGHHPLTSKNLALFKTNITRLIRAMSHPLIVQDPDTEEIIKLNPVIREWFYVIELVYNPDGFYYHAHVCYDGNYVKQKILSNLWKNASRGSTYAYIQEIKNLKQACNDVAKYLSKPFNGISLARWVAVLKGNKLFSRSQNPALKQAPDPATETIDLLMSGTYENQASLVTGRSISTGNRRCSSTGLTCQIHNKPMIPLSKKESRSFEDSIPPPKGLRTPQNYKEYHQLAVDGVSRCI